MIQSPTKSSTGKLFTIFIVPAWYLASVCQDAIQQTFAPEIERLKALQQVNPNVRDKEIQFFEQQLQQLIGALKSSNLRLDAVRVIVAT